VDAVGLLDRVDGDDPRMIESSERLRLAPEALEPLRARGHPGRQHLERDLAAELGVHRAIDLAHPAGADRGGDAVVRERPADQGSVSYGLGGEPERCVSGVAGGRILPHDRSRKRTFPRLARR
jgi:hypothetical protein